MLGSTSYRAQGAIEAFAGEITSTSYQQEGGGSFQYYCGDGFIDPGETCDGADLDGETCSSQGFASGTLTCSTACALVTSACNSGGGGGGGGGGSPSTVPDAPSIDTSLINVSFSYNTSLLLFGGKGTSVDSVSVNGSSISVTFPTSSSWQKEVALSYGANIFSLISVDGSLNSAATAYQIYRRLIGDITGDDSVNDYDLSKLVGLWGDDDRSGDFNEDGEVDDYDFSMMVARWGTSV
jgi:hypothetical protein